MTPVELDHFLHQLTEAMTVLRGWTHLAMRELPNNAPQQRYLERVQHSVMLTEQVIQEQLRRIQEDV